MRRELRTSARAADSVRRCGSTGFSRCPAQVSGGVSDRVADVDHAVVESSVVKQLEVESYASRQRRLAAADEDRAQQQHALVDQAVPEGLGRYPRASDAHVRARGLLDPSYRLGLELPLDPRARGRYVGQGGGVDDLVGVTPDPGVVADHRGLVRQPVVALPHAHRLVHASPVERRADVPLVLVPERVHVLVRHGPVERTGLVLEEAVERDVGRVDQLTHGALRPDAGNSVRRDRHSQQHRLRDRCARREERAPLEGLHGNRDRAESFGLVAEQYDRLRSSYPTVFIDYLAAWGPINAVDIGCGTGKVARALVEREVRVLGVEPDEAMAAVARNHGIRVELARFETRDPAGRTVDLVTAGHAWHWVDPNSGLAKVASVLEPGGTVALFWNYHAVHASLAEVFDGVYAVCAPELEALGRDPTGSPGRGPFLGKRPLQSGEDAHVPVAA